MCSVLQLSGSNTKQKKMLCYLFPLFHLDGASVCGFVYVRGLDDFCMRVCQYFKCAVHEQFWTKI